ncbi:MAG: GAF domain-containing protein [Campylobacterota bacterium]
MQERSTQVTGFDKDILDKASLADGLDYISVSAKSIFGAERCSIFMYDQEENKLWTTLADGTEKIIIPYDIGIVGQTIRVEKPIIENEPYGNANFLSDVDMQTGYYTQNILTAPIFNGQNKIIGVLQLLNKEGAFSKKDAESIASFSKSISGFITAQSHK